MFHSVQFFLIVIVIGLSQQVIPDKKCKIVPGCDIDVDWYSNISKTGWNVGMGSKLEPQLSIPDPPKKKNKTLKNRQCYMNTINTQIGRFPTPYICRHSHKLSEQFCVLKTNGTPFEQVFKFYGKITLTKTDNETYVVAYGCMSAEDQQWTVFIPRDKLLDTKTEDEIREHIKSLGFSLDEKYLRNDGDFISYGGMKSTECNNQTTASTKMTEVNSRKNETEVVKSNNQVKEKPEKSEKDKSKSNKDDFDEVLKLLNNPLDAYKVN